MESDKERIERLEKAYRDLWSEHELLKQKIKEQYAEFKEIRDRFQVKPYESVSEAAQPVAAVVPESNVPVSKPVPAAEKKVTESSKNTSLEQFIGEKLLSKIGIAIVLIGLVIGANYAIEHDLIGEAMRVVLGYAVAVVLGGFAYSLRHKMRPFSSVLASGAVATAYFMTYAGFSFYQIFSLPVAFAGMLLVIAVSIMLAWYYNQVIIAHLGLIGAYILPPLVATGDKHIIYYLVYMFLIDVGMLVISWRRKWNSIPYPIMAWTVLIYLFWFMNDFDRSVDATIAGASLLGFFFVFLASIVGRNYWSNEPMRGIQISQLILVSISFFGSIGFVYGNELTLDKLAFILVGSGTFFAMQRLFRHKQTSDVEQAFRVFGIFGIATLLTFLTGEYSYLLVLALGIMLLQWLAPLIEGDMEVVLGVIASIAMIFLVIIAAFLELSGVGYDYHRSDFVFPGTAGMITACGATIYVLLNRFQNQALDQARWKMVGATVLVTLFFGGLIGIDCAYRVSYANKSATDLFISGDYSKLQTYYNALFFACSGLFVLAYNRFILGVKNSSIHLQVYLLLISTFSLLIYSVYSDELRELHRFPEGWSRFNLIKYVSFTGVVITALGMIRMNSARNWIKMFALMLILWVLSQELVQWSLIGGFGVGYKILLSLLWAVFAVGMIVVGIKRKVPILRVTAMVILGVTLLKMFFYDLNALSTISKTVVFVIIGGLLLLGAYFYQNLSKNQD